MAGPTIATQPWHEWAHVRLSRAVWTGVSQGLFLKVLHGAGTLKICSPANRDDTLAECLRQGT